jgi:hypothetical protein
MSKCNCIRRGNEQIVRLHFLFTATKKKSGQKTIFRRVKQEEEEKMSVVSPSAPKTAFFTSLPMLAAPTVGAIVGHLMFRKVRNASNYVALTGILVAIIVYAASVATMYWAFRRHCIAKDSKDSTAPKTTPWKKICGAAAAPAVIVMLPFFAAAFLKRELSATLNKPGKMFGGRGGGGASAAEAEGAEGAEMVEADAAAGPAAPLLIAAQLGNSMADHHPGILIVWPTIWCTILGYFAASFTSWGVVAKCN